MNRLFTKTLIAEAVIIAISVCSAIPTVASVLEIPTAPLITSKSVKPNMMLFLDSSGSMEYIVEDSLEYDANSYSFNCSDSKTLSNASSVRIKITNAGNAYFNYDGDDYDFGNASGNGVTGHTRKCFDNDLLYYAELYAANGGSTRTKTTTGYPGAVYKGNFLNWYFSPTGGSSNFTTGARKRNDTNTRIEVARSATNSLIDSLDKINIGISMFDAGNGAKILANMLDVDISANKNTLKTKVNSVDAGSGGTPLAEALQELGRYFTIGYSATENLAIHPDTSNEIDVKVSDFFTQLPDASEVGLPSEVTQNWCQQNFIVAMTDGQSTNDQNNFSTYLQDYDGDCVGASCNDHDKKTTGGYTYQGSGSDYADDVLLAMHDIDLRPDLSNGSTDVKNNVTTYMVGFAEQALVNDPLMADMAAAGGGGDLLTAANSSELALAFQRATESIFAKVAAGSGVAFNTTQFSTDSSVYAASFNSAKWSGSLKAFELSDLGVISSNASWDAGAKLDAMTYSDRNIFSYNADTQKGITLEKDNLSSAQLGDFQSGPKGSIGVGSLINYIKGDRSNEGSSATDYRVRDSALGDIVNSTLVYVGAPQLNWPSYATNSKFGTTAKNYSQFKSSNATRSPMLYAGANDGMLHGFNANKADASVGEETVAYIPGLISSAADEEGLHYLAQDDYAHRFYVDLTPTVSDVYIDSDWRTILVGGLRGGGKGLFALDITDPTKFNSSPANAESLSLWEFSNSDDADFGYSYSKPTIAMMENGKWAIIVGNGYNNSGDGKAKLFIIYAEKNTSNNGAWSLEYVKIDTGVGSAATPNGLSTPRAVDLDGDSVVDRIYAGDLQGNMWAFDVDSSNDSQWDVAYSQGQDPKPLFTATDSAGNAQPITTAPILAKNINTVYVTANAPDILVFFGTGKYLENADKTSTATMSYYGVLDDNSGEKGRADLKERKLITAGNKRVVSGSNIDWSSIDGWYFDLVDRATEASATVQQLGERVISNSLIRNDTLLFSTAIPSVANSDVCVSNSESWLMAIDLNTGKAPEYTVFDVNNDALLDEADTTADYDSNADDMIDSDDKVSFGAVKLGASMVAGDISIIGDNVYSNDVDGNLSKLEVSIEGTEKQGRLSWEELIKK